MWLQAPFAALPLGFVWELGGKEKGRHQHKRKGFREPAFPLFGNASLEELKKKQEIMEGFGGFLKTLKHLFLLKLKLPNKMIPPKVLPFLSFPF